MKIRLNPHSTFSFHDLKLTLILSNQYKTVYNINCRQEAITFRFQVHYGIKCHHLDFSIPFSIWHQKLREDQFLVHYPIRVFLCIVTGTFYWIIKIEAFLSGNTFNGSLLPPSYTSHIHTLTRTHIHAHTQNHTERNTIHKHKERWK